MTDPDGSDGQPTPARRTYRDVPGEAIDYRAPDDEDGVFEVRMPIATTGEVRNEGDDPLTRDELAGMARQIDDGGVPVFLDHGQTDLGGHARYSAVEKVGEWTGGDVQERDADDTDELVATARLMDPETLPAATGSLRESLAAVKEQVQRDMSLSASIGWRDDDAFAGGVDLMEASIVGIGADPRTTSDASAAVVARAAAEAGADPDRLVALVRASVDGERPIGPPEDPDRFDSFEECVSALQDDEDLSREEAERICGSWEAAKDEQSHDMTDTDTESDTEADAEQDEQPDDERAPDWAQRLVELQEQQMDTLDAIESSLREDDEDDDDDEEDENQAEDDDEDEGPGEDEDEDDDEQSADADAETQALEDELADLRSELAELREGGLDADDVDTPDADDEQSADDEPAASDDDWRAYT